MASARDLLPVPLAPTPTATPGTPAPDRLWYVAYGSNAHSGRLARYLQGGRLPGTGAVYPGCRDPRTPERSLPVVFPGAVYFATESRVWGGGRAFYDPGADGSVLGRAHLVSVGQFSDIAAQEMYREPGEDLDLAGVLARGRQVLGDGRYETLVRCGYLDGVPALTFTAPWRMSDVPWRPPSAAYLWYLVAGLAEAGAWNPEEIASYVAACPGAAGHWSARAVAELVRRGRPPQPGRPGDG